MILTVTADCYSLFSVIVTADACNADLFVYFQVLAQASEGQQVLVQLLSAIKAMPIDTLVQTLHQVVKQPAMNQVLCFTLS